jgi:hypothetical protein
MTTKSKFPLGYRTIQRIKAEEYERFFSQQPEYSQYINHLGEIEWMTEEEAYRQHEFFRHSQSAWEKLKRKLRLSRKLEYAKLNPAERELRLYFRKYLEEKYLGKVQPQTARELPGEWSFAINPEELENITLLDDFGNEAIWKLGFTIISIIAVLAVIGFIWSLSFQKEPAGRLLVKSVVQGGRVYLDDTKFIGYTNTEIGNVPVGHHRISAIKDGYLAVPPYQEVEMKADSLVSLNFKFNTLRSEMLGYLKVQAPQKDSKVFINNIFYSRLDEENIFDLEEGQYRVTVQKEGFLTIPVESIVHIVMGDTTLLSIQQDPIPNRQRGYPGIALEQIGTLAVTSNVIKARIFINGRDSGELTDHIFTQMQLGSYMIQVKKEGYLPEPEAREISLTRLEPAGNAVFNLIQKLEQVSIRTVPASGRIFIDGEFKAEGKFEGQFPIGEHALSFGDISGYKKPRNRNFTVKAGSPLELEILYFPELRISAGIDNQGKVYNQKCDVYSGHTFKDRAFTASNEGGPSIEFNEKLNDYFWKLGYAYPYRNPKGNDAVKVTFILPQNLEYDQKFVLKIEAASSREKYPLSVSSNVEILIKFNNTIMSYYYVPKFVENLGAMETTEWDISSAVKGGLNTLEISTTDKNNTFYYLKSIEIFN